MEQIKTRKFSLEDDFMNFTVDDLIFGYIQHSATFAPELNKLYITKAKITKAKADMALMIDKTKRTVDNKIKKLVERGLLIETTIPDKKGDPIFVYEIPQETIGRYEILQDDMVWYIVSTRRMNALKIYIYLFNKFKWKKQEGNEMYSFTNQELLAALGYSAQTSQKVSTECIEMLLQSFKREGVIDYVEYCDKERSAHVTMRKRLLFVASSPNDLKKV